MLEFVEERLKTGHVCPLEQVWFEFALAGVSRAFSHQFVRHRVGISFEQQSQRYVVYMGGASRTPCPTPCAKRLRRTVRQRDGADRRVLRRDGRGRRPGEDARFVLPNATTTNFKITINFASLLHMADLRLCTRAQWEFRRVVSLMRAEIFRRFPSWPPVAAEVR